MKNSVILTVIGASLLLASCGSNAPVVGNSASGLAPVHMAQRDGIAGQYIVVFKPGAVPADLTAQGEPGSLSAQSASALVSALRLDPAGVQVQHLYSQALSGFAAQLSAQNLQTLRADPRVDYIEEDQMMWASQTVQSSPPSWGLDRIDQRNLPLNGRYEYFGASASTIYILDTGIRSSHQDFGGRVRNHVNTTGDGQNTDCNGHGTHVAGTAAGNTHGVAKNASLVGVKVLGCTGGGTNSGIIAGVDWVRGQTTARKVANMSLGGGASSALDTAVNNLASSGAVVVVAAGNENQNACNVSPARASGVYTVGSTTNTDARSSFSNFGSCVNLFAPGSNIRAAWHTGDTVYNTISGTSMASPHVAGAAAVVWNAFTSYSQSQVTGWLTNNSTTGVLSGVGTGSPNRLLYIR